METPRAKYADLSFWRNRREINVGTIGSTGKVGQVVVLGISVGWGEKYKSPLSKYPVPSIFTIREKVEKNGEDEGYYVLEDSDGNRINVVMTGIYNDSRYLSDAQKWMTWNDERENNTVDCLRNEITRLSDHEELLKGILANPVRVYVLTPEQAQELGFNT